MGPADRELLTSTRTVDLTTIGARSRRPSRIEIWAWWFEERYIITGTPGKRDWVANILANPRVTVHIGSRDYTGRASVVDDARFRRRFFVTTDAHWYRTQSELDHLVAAAPMIEVRFD